MGLSKSESRGSPAAGEQGFDSSLSFTDMSPNKRQPKPQGPALVRGKVSSRVGARCAWRWQWHWQWWGDNVAASICVGGDSGVRREVEIWGALLTDFLDSSVGVKGSDFHSLKAFYGELGNHRKCVFKRFRSCLCRTLWCGNEAKQGFGQVEENLTCYEVEGRLWRSPHHLQQMQMSPPESASRVCFILPSPASDNEAHIMGSCTALHWGRKLIQIMCFEGKDLISWQVISGSASLKASCK